MMKMNKLIVISITILFLLSFTGSVFAEINLDELPVIEGQNKIYSAKKGEDLYPIARKYSLAIEHLMFANGMSGLKTYAGQKLLIPLRRIPPSANPGDGLVLNLPERMIYYFKDGKARKFYPVAIGARGKWMTPTGDHKIITKIKNPIWIPPEWANAEKPVPAGPDNPLGDRWMGLNKPGVGIHATNSPMSIGLATSHGCIRMYPELAHDLFDRVKENMPVKIVYEPVKIGYDPVKKQICMEVYPDVYDRTSGLVKYARQKLSDFGLLNIVDQKTLEKIVNAKKGIPEPIVGSDIIIKVNDKRQDEAFSPLYLNKTVLAPSGVLKSIGATLTWKSSKRYAIINKGKSKVNIPVIKVDDKSAGSVSADDALIIWQGKPFVPLSYVLKGLDITYFWMPEYKTVLIYPSRAGSDQGERPSFKNRRKQQKPPVAAEPPKPVAPKPAVTPSRSAMPVTPSVTPEIYENSEPEIDKFIPAPASPEPSAGEIYDEK